MKKLILILVVLLAACATTKKSALTTEVVNVTAGTSSAESTNTEKLIDTTSTDKGKITITEIEFFPPVAAEIGRPPGANASGVNLPNVGDIGSAAVKTIRQTTIEQDTVRKGESKEYSSTTMVKNETLAANTEKTSAVDEAPAPDPHRWRYIFYVMLLGVIACLYLKRVPILNWLKTILASIKRLFGMS